MKKVIIIVLAFTAISLIEYKSAISYPQGAPDGNTGSPYDAQTCASYCHAGAPVTTLPGLISSNIPASGYIPGTTYTITAQINGIGHTKFGFQISPMDSLGNVLGAMAEQNSETQITGMGRYITHTLSATDGPGSRTWVFDWTAPNNVSKVTFYGAFNVTNNNSSSSGDTVYTTTYKVHKDTSNLTAIDVLATKTGLAVFPNPVKDYFTVQTQDQDSEAEIKIYALDGREVYHAHVPQVNGTYSLPEHVLSGIYYIQVQTLNNRYLHKIMVHKQ